MLVIELDKEVIRKLKAKTKLRGAISRVAEVINVHRTTIPRVLKEGTATEDVAAKITEYINAEA